MEGFDRLGQAQRAWRADADYPVRAHLRGRRLSASSHALGRLHLCSRRQSLRCASDWDSDPPDHRAAICVGGAHRLLCWLVLAASVDSMPTRIFNSTLIYDVILVVVLGGIGLSGGRGGVINVILGTLLIGTMLNGMTIMNMSYAAQNLVKGVVLLAAVLADSFLNPRNEETAQQGDI